MGSSSPSSSSSSSPPPPLLLPPSLGATASAPPARPGLGLALAPPSRLPGAWTAGPAASRCASSTASSSLPGSLPGAAAAPPPAPAAPPPGGPGSSPGGGGGGLGWLKRRRSGEPPTAQGAEEGVSSDEGVGVSAAPPSAARRSACAACPVWDTKALTRWSTAPLGHGRLGSRPGGCRRAGRSACSKETQPVAHPMPGTLLPIQPTQRAHVYSPRHTAPHNHHSSPHRVACPRIHQELAVAQAHTQRSAAAARWPQRRGQRIRRAAAAAAATLGLAGAAGWRRSAERLLGRRLGHREHSCS